MAKVLYITANPKPEEQSYSLRVGRAFLEAYRVAKPDDEITELDLYRTDVPYLDRDVFAGWDKLQQGMSFAQLTQDEQLKVSRINELADQFIEADKYVFVTPMWNFSVPPLMKAYIDSICISGKTFVYTERGPVGLMTEKKAVHIQARGGIYSEGMLAEMEQGDRYLHTIFKFIGITDARSIYVEGMGQLPGEVDRIERESIQHAKLAAKEFAAYTLK